MMAAAEPGRPEAAPALAALPRLAAEDLFDFVCVGCGDCCRARRDLLLSGLDLWRLARRLRLPPRLVANAFCRLTIGESTLLPTLRLAPQGKNGDCPFLDAGACAVHSARPLACALYPLGQAIDPHTAKAEYYWQLPRCGAPLPEGRTLQTYLQDAGVCERYGADVQWAKHCLVLSERLAAAGGTGHPRYAMAAHRIARALYFDYSEREEFYPQFRQNMEELPPLLERILGGQGNTALSGDL